MTDGDWIESKDQDPQGEVRLIQLADIGDGEFLNRSSRFVTTETAERLRCTYLEPGDVLIARMPDPLGRACVFPGVGQAAITAVDVCVWKPGRNAADPRWLMHAINSPDVREALALLAGGTTRQRVSGGNLKRFELPVPPLAEQRRIVERIEALFARTRRARADLLRVAHLADRHADSALGAAYSEGSDAGLVPLGDLVDGLRYGTAQKCTVERQGMAVLRIPNVAGGRIDLADLKYAELDAKEQAKLRLVAGDILIIRSNGSPGLVGRPALVDAEAEGMAFAGYLIRARPRRDRVVPGYLAFMLQAPQIRSHIEINARSSSGVHNINAEELGALTVPLPSLEVQQHVVRALEASLAASASANRDTTRALALLDRLDQSILAKAFRGELVPQDPSDEPASVTLATTQVSEATPVRRRRMSSPPADRPAARSRSA